MTFEAYQSRLADSRCDLYFFAPDDVMGWRCSAVSRNARTKYQRLHEDYETNIHSATRK